jgi:hypothetical protein
LVNCWRAVPLRPTIVMVFAGSSNPVRKVIVCSVRASENDQTTSSPGSTRKVCGKNHGANSLTTTAFLGRTGAGALLEASGAERAIPAGPTIAAAAMANTISALRTVRMTTPPFVD